MRKILLMLFLLIIYNCEEIPEKKYYQFSFKTSSSISNDTLKIKIENPLKCPLIFEPKTKKDETHSFLTNLFPITLAPEKDTIILKKVINAEKIKIKFNAKFGYLEDTVKLEKISLPFPFGKKYKINQGYNGKFSHQSKRSKYAIDFNLKQGDTICAAANGYVVGVIEDYKYGGNSKEWRDYANYITIYHPKRNIYTQYVHLKHKGSFVTVGDEIVANQPIALSGNTGFTSGEHLHFNVLRSGKNGWESIKIMFKENFDHNTLKKGKWVTKTNL